MSDEARSPQLDITTISVRWPAQAAIVVSTNRLAGKVDGRVEPAPSIDFLVSAGSRRPQLVDIAEPEAQFLAGALSGLAPDADMPNARSIAVTIETALASETELLELPPHQERELLFALDQIARQLPRVLTPDLLRLRNALAEAADVDRSDRLDSAPRA